MIEGILLSLVGASGMAATAVIARIGMSFDRANDWYFIVILGER